MKKKISKILVILSVIFLLGCGADVEQKTEEFVPTPVVIETIDEKSISNPRPATVTIVTPYKDTQCWTGLMYENPDGEMTRITLFDAVESTFDDNF